MGWIPGTPKIFHGMLKICFASDSQQAFSSDGCRTRDYRSVTAARGIRVSVSVGIPPTPAILVVAIGVLVGPLALDELAVRPTSSIVRTLAEATLAVVLFSDSSRIDLRALKSEASMPARLLGVGLILTVVAGGFTAFRSSSRSF